MTAQTRRTMVVKVSDTLIEDGEVTPPRVGEVATLPLRFVETAGDSAESVTIHALLDPDTSAPVWQYTGGTRTRQWEWSGLLRGDGWTAAWSGSRPRTGRVMLIGKFLSALDGYVGGAVRGRVTRVQIVSERMRRVGSDGWELEPGHRQLRDVDAAPRFFERPVYDAAIDAAIAAEPEQDWTGVRFFSAGGHLPGEFDSDTGVLVDLDLDDVPAPRSRPTFDAGDVSAAAGLLWVVDSQLPLVVSIDQERHVQEHLLPSPIGSHLKLSASPSGCWVTGDDGVFRIDSGGQITRIDEHKVTAAMALGETLLACGPDRRWALHTPGQNPLVLEAPEGRVYDAVVDDGSFVVLVGDGDATWLARVTPEGDVTVGPQLHNIRSRNKTALVCDPLRLFVGASASLVERDLTLSTSQTLPARPLVVGQIGDYVWITGHAPEGTRPGGWWPMSGPTTYARTEEQTWLLTLLDSQTLEPVRSAQIFSPSPRVAIDDDGTVWVVAGRLWSISENTMQWPAEVDVAALLDANDRV